MPEMPTQKIHDEEHNRRIRFLEEELAKAKKTIQSQQAEISRLSEDEEKFRKIFDMSTGLICLADLNTARFIEVNPAFEKTLGYSREELLKGSFLKFIHPDDVLKTVEMLNNELEKEIPSVNFENRYLHKEGHYRWLSWSSRPMKKKGLSYAWAIDITRRKEYEAALMQKNQFTQIIQDNLPIGIALNAFDTGEVIYTNRKFDEIYGWPSKFLQNVENFFLCVYPDEAYRSKIKSRVMEDILSGDINRMCWEDVEITTQKGEKKYIIANNIPLSEQNTMVSTVQDMTGRKKAELDLVSLLKEKEVLIKEIHHRVKNNLQIISSLLTLQASHSNDGYIKEILDECKNRVQSIAIIHKNLYESNDFSRVSIKRFGHDFLVSIAHLYQMQNIKFDMKMADINLPIDLAIPCAIIINELVSNAIKHAFSEKQQGLVKVSLEQNKQNDYVLAVSDNGCGLPKGFDFENWDSLGISLIRDLSKQINGQVSIETKKGTQFTLVFKAFDD
ncbi:MAG: PAS domain S-box protein [Spirochaetales bacterium]|nr:PAS domain S-box protein [Spirochaetales bacterium]